MLRYLLRAAARRRSSIFAPVPQLSHCKKENSEAGSSGAPPLLGIPFEAQRGNAAPPTRTPRQRLHLGARRAIAQEGCGGMGTCDLDIRAERNAQIPELGAAEEV
ncbi:hypothetical protein D4764_18G0007910 [Takifugu flavidus]|uniref:Uncharacterized protein n=1 Tax=Takifugu flavidus TaxID=433684 RepID=A0A5C6NSN6_9TELE|nr:hypothetical protein D4764_18G0007910 [Takifugu flavidus]